MYVLKIALLSLALCWIGISWAEDLPNPTENNLANIHLQDEDCAGACHEKEEPSEDLEFEDSSCVECHEAMVELDGKQHNVKHQDDGMACIECHIPHEETDPKELCADCHEEGEEALEVFKSGQVHKETLLNNELVSRFI